MANQISNPVSTGNAGGTYESRVQAAHLLAMLLGMPLAGLPDYRVMSLTFQARIEGFETDDLLCQLESTYGGPRKRLIQIKRSLEATPGHAPFRQAVSKAWLDYANPDLFIRSVDSIAIICDYQAGVATRDAKSLTDFARSSLTVDEFLRKVETRRFSSESARATYTDIKTAIERETAGNGPTDDEQAFRFLQHVHFQNYELASESGELLVALLGLIELRVPAQTSSHAVWAGLVQLCAELNQKAGSVSLTTWRDIAPPWLSASLSESLPGNNPTLLALRGRRELMEGAIQSALPNGTTIERAEIVEQILDSLRTAPLTLVVGDAGSGKSALAKRVSEIFGADGFVLFLKAEDLDHTSLHTALASLGAGNPADFLRRNLFLGQQNLIFVDGIEKVVEFSSREAFVQLLSFAKQNAAWKLCATVRSHAVQPLCDGLFMDLPYRFVNVPHLTDAELDRALEQVSTLPAISNPALRSVLRIPFYLRLAIGAAGVNATTHITSVSQLKRILWAQAVTNPLDARVGLPQRRRRAFKSVCFERAKRVMQFVRPPDDSEAISALVKDHILVEDRLGMVAPAHDIFDDWALAEIIETCAQDAERNWAIMFDELGLHPGIRRAFRRWIAEDVVDEDGNAAALLEASLTDISLPQQWRDDAVVGMLQSTAASDLVSRYERVLIAQNHEGLKRVIHLLRVACKGPKLDIVNVPGDSAVKQVIALRHIFTAPAGSGWLPLILVVHRNVQNLKQSDAEWVAQLLEDGQSLLVGNNASTEGATAALLLALALLRQQGTTGWSYHRTDIGQRLLHLVLNLTGGGPKEVDVYFRHVLSALYEEENEREALEVLERSIDSYHSLVLCKHLPLLVVEIFNAIVFKHNESAEDWPHRLDIPELFGISSTLNDHNYFPASAYQGPFWYLLRQHPVIGVDLVIALCNRTAEHYANSELGHEVWRISVPFRDDRSLIFSWRLWGLYRGMGVGPNILCSALMALEKMLLESARSDMVHLDWLLERILEQGSSAMTASVVASVITAFPKLVTAKLIGILRVRDFYVADMSRSAGESTVDAGLNIFPGIGGQDKFHRDERQASNSENHRGRHLEDVAFQLQFTSSRDEVLAILDKFSQELPNVEHQTSEDRLWRLALHRMDSRQTTLGERTAQGVVIKSLPVPDDLRSMVDEGAQQAILMDSAARVQLWAMSHFAFGKPEHRRYFADWREALSVLRNFNERSEPDHFLRLINLDALLASAVLQSYPSELAGEQQWVLETILDAVNQNSDTQSHEHMMSKNRSDGSRLAAYVLPLLMNNSAHREAAVNALATALTHAVFEIREFAAIGVRQHLWKISTDAAQTCVASLLNLGLAVDTALKGPFDTWQEQAGIAVKKSREALRLALLSLKKIEIPTLSQLPHSWQEPIAAFAALSHEVAPDLGERMCRNFVRLLLDALANSKESNRRKKRNGEINYDLRHTIVSEYAGRLHLRQRLDDNDIELIGKLTVEHPDVCSEWFRELISAEDRQSNAEQFWRIWNEVARLCLLQPEISSPKTRHYRGNYDDLIKTLLFHKTYWRENAKSWPAFVNHTDFFADLPIEFLLTPPGFEAFCALLAGIGREALLPRGLIILAKAWEQASPRFNPLASNDVALYMEIVLREVVVSSTTQVRADALLKSAILRLLDELVNAGSSIAFQLRDYLAAPTTV
ncbi:MoxR-like ATPase [Paraburkholderia phenazinium]|uniref:MoxR-like ATPase n=1 Tax=Paraburkholderia phenazinium TaxID=60549 RepID=A0A1G7WRL4_9BURK|nr:ATP-binding protein [Paraburkholderia phenazinium]SDG74625.1 MoxR-like ATPase [Paraburkholderia phenazinium]